MIQIAENINEPKKRKRIINSLRLSRARLAVKSNLLSPETRKKRIPDLVELGDQSDVEVLKSIIKDHKELDEIKTLAIGIILLIEEKLKQNGQQPNQP